MVTAPDTNERQPATEVEAWLTPVTHRWYQEDIPQQLCVKTYVFTKSTGILFIGMHPKVGSYSPVSPNAKSDCCHEKAENNIRHSRRRLTKLTPTGAMDKRKVMDDRKRLRLRA